MAAPSSFAAKEGAAMPKHDPKQRHQHRKQAAHLVADLLRLAQAVQAYGTDRSRRTWQIQAHLESQKGYLTELAASGLASGEVLF
jgi:hypothetical protein